MEVAAGMTAFNPLRCSGTALPPQLLLVAKLIICGLLLKGFVQRIPGIFVPMWPVLDHLPRPELAQPLMQAVVVVCGGMLLCNIGVRTCAFAIGVTFIFATLASRGFYSNGRLFCSSMLMLIGLYSSEYSIWPIRWQTVLLYLGAGLNKITQADWRSGWYFENWMRDILEREWYAALASALPPMALSQFFCWATIAMEFAIAIGLTVPRLYRIGIWLALLFHFGSVAMTGTMFGIFVIAVTFSLLVFVEWPNAGEIEIVKAPRQGAVRTILNLARRLDFDHVLRFVTTRDGPQVDTGASLRVQWRDRTYTNLGAVRRIALSLPVSYFLAALALIAPSLYLRWTGP